MARRSNCRRVKIHRTYTIAELAALLGVHSGFCPTCERPIYRAVSLATIEQKLGGLIVALPMAEQRISDISPPFSNIDLRQDTRT
jgi:hypothetical protein